MKSRLWLNLFLALLVVGLVLLVIYEPGKAPPPTAISLSEHKAQDIQRMEIIRRDHPTVVLERHDGQWWMQSPYALPAQQQTIEKLLGLLGAQSQAQYDFTAVDTQALGLDEPNLLIRFDHELMAFGGTDALQGMRYVQAGNTIHLIVDRYSYLARAEPASLVNHRLLADDGKIQALDLPGLSLQLVNGEWKQEGQAALSADDRQAFLDRWRHARALKVRAATTEVPASAEGIRIQLEGRDQPLQFQLIKQDEEVTLRRQDVGLDYVFSAPVAEGLLNPASIANDVSQR
jgi:hypothetical protein